MPAISFLADERKGLVVMHGAGVKEDRGASRPLPMVHFMLRSLGAILLVLAYLIAVHLIRIGPTYHGHEPFGIYLLSMILFFCASAGAATLIHGHHLFDRIIVSQRWIAHPPPSMLLEEMTPDSEDGPRHDPVP